jgi:hypothetical protein
MHLGGSLQILHIRVEPKGKGPPTGEGLLCEAVKISIIDSGGAMRTLEEVAIRIMALEVANAGGRSKSKA